MGGAVSYLIDRIDSVTFETFKVDAATRLLTDVVFEKRIRVIRNEAIGAVVDDLAEVAQTVEIVVYLKEHPLTSAISHFDGFIPCLLHPFV